MGSSLVTTGLFIDQVRQNSEALTYVLSNGCIGEAGSTELLDKCIRSTRMLEGSTLVMGLDAWNQYLNKVRELLTRYRDDPLEWDEGIAQVISELIDKEELLVSANDAGEIVDLACIVSDEEIQALIREITVVLDTRTISPTREGGQDRDMEPEEPPSHPEKNAQAPDVERPLDEITRFAKQKEDVERLEQAGWSGPSVIEAQSPLAVTRAALERTVGSLNRALAEGSWPGAAAEQAKSHHIRRHLCMLEFFSRSMNEMLELRELGTKEPMPATLEPIQNTLEDYAGLLCGIHGRSITVEFNGAENTIDANLLFDAGQVLRCLVRDVVLRCDDPELRIQVEVSEKNGALWWEVKDNGNNFIKDSRFDRDECLAFYPSLKEVRKTLAALNSILWVEPECDQQTRFVFTIRTNREHEKFIVWGEGGDSYGVLSTQFCSVLPADSDEVSIESDSRGEHLVVDDHKVPLVRLQLVYPDAPDGGDRIAIIGSLEHKAAMYVNGDGRVEDGIWRRDKESAWKGLPRGVAEMDEKQVPVIEAGDLLVRYMNASGEAVEDGVSGGVAGDGNDLLPESQATFMEDASSPPAYQNEVGEEVLVVEQSKAVAETFENINSSAKFNMKILDRVEDALAAIRSGDPRLIISEFRMPTLAAQRIKEALLKEGKDVPIVVTTSHSGSNADLLVQKLGVSDYLSKPLQPEKVSEKVNQYLNRSGSSKS